MIPKTGTQHTNIVESLKRQGICEEARKKIYVPNNANPSRAITTTIHDIAAGLYYSLWKELAFEEQLWAEQLRAHETANERLGVLLAAATSVSNGRYSFLI
jgi:hypothetical protein